MIDWNKYINWDILEDEEFYGFPSTSPYKGRRTDIVFFCKKCDKEAVYLGEKDGQWYAVCWDCTCTHKRLD